MTTFNSSYFRKGKFFRKDWENVEWILWLVPFLLVSLSSILIASIQRQYIETTWNQHIITGIVGIIFALIFAQLHLERLRNLLLPLYLITVSSLIAVKIFGVSALGSQRWLSIGSFNIQPSEIAKISLIIILASVLEKKQFKALSDLSKPFAVILIPWFLVFIQPDLGTSLVFGAVLLTMLFWAGMPFEWVLLCLSGIFTAILVGIFPEGNFFWIPFMVFLAYRSLPKKRFSSFITLIFLSAIAFSTPWLWFNALKEYQRDRLILFLDPAKDPLGGGYHLIQSSIGIGSGGLFGTGLLQGQLTKLRFIPEQHTDFIFSALGEELGFIGSLAVTTAFFVLIYRILKIAQNAHTEFESLIVIGIASMMTFQVVVNIFMTIGLGPVTGIPLPFMSYGRTALLVSFIALGCCLSVSRRSKAFHRNL